jgi:hypothetical protein
VTATGGDDADQNKSYVFLNPLRRVFLLVVGAVFFDFRCIFDLLILAGMGE